MFDNITRYTEKDVEQLLSQKLGKAYVEYRKKWKEASPENVPSFPVHIDFELIDQCNQRCVMCPRNQSTHGKISYPVNTGIKLSFIDFKRIVDEGVRQGLSSVNLGAFGEPLLHEDVFEMVRYTHRSGVVDSRVITNGLFLHKFTDHIFESGLVHLFVSIDAACEETYRKIRGDGFKKAEENLNAIIKEKKGRGAFLPIIRVSFVDMPENEKEKETFIEKWRESVDLIDIQIYDDFGFDLDSCLDCSIKKKWECRSPWQRLAVLADGTILPCCNFYGRNLLLGNIRELTIKQAWDSESLREIRQGILADNRKICGVCQRAGK